MSEPKFKLLGERHIGDARHLHGAIEVLLAIGKVTMMEQPLIKLCPQEETTYASIVRLWEYPQSDGTRKLEMHIL
jgi:hypothetical protein